VRRFFEDYKKLERKAVTVEGFLGPDEARKAIESAQELYAGKKEALLAETAR
jgi:inorganic pyrophosphatase